MKKIILLLLIASISYTSKAQIYVMGGRHFLNIKGHDYEKDVKSIVGTNWNLGFAINKKLYLGLSSRVNAVDIDEKKTFIKLAPDFYSNNNITFTDASFGFDIGYISKINEDWRVLNKIGYGAFAVVLSPFEISNGSETVYTKPEPYEGSSLNFSSNFLYNFHENIGITLGVSYYTAKASGKSIITTNVDNTEYVYNGHFKGSIFSFNIGMYFQLFNPRE